jgi:hypothetical protein
MADAQARTRPFGAVSIMKVISSAGSVFEREKLANDQPYAEGDDWTHFYTR